MEKGSRRVRERERGLEDAMLIDLKMKEGATSHGMQAASRSWKWQENRFFTRASRRNIALPTS